MIQAYCSYFASVSVFPEIIVSTPGGNLSFKCIFLSAVILDFPEWLINGSAALVNESIELGIAVTQFSEEVATGALHFHNLPLNFNTTKIQCYAVLPSRTETSNNYGLLLLQG